MRREFKSNDVTKLDISSVLVMRYNDRVIDRRPKGRVGACREGLFCEAAEVGVLAVLVYI